MTDIAVVIPSWDYQRSLSLVRVLYSLEQWKRAEYIVVIPQIEQASELQPDLLEWLEAESPEGIQILATSQYLSPVEAMARGGTYLMAQQRGPGHSPSDIFLFLHDDTQFDTAARGWDRTIIDHFATHERCGLAGFGGGTGFGHPDIYKLPYDYHQLARYDFISNMREAEQHGRRVTSAQRVAALDGFSLAVSREFYERAGYVCKGPGDPTHDTRSSAARGLWDACLRDGIHFHMYDAWVSCRAVELGYETWMLPLPCHHVGGQTSVARDEQYQEVCRRLGYHDGQDLYDRAHERVYERFRRVLPIRVS